MSKISIVTRNMVGPNDIWNIPEEINTRFEEPKTKEVDFMELTVDSDEEDEGYGSFGKQFLDLSLFAVEKEEEKEDEEEKESGDRSLAPKGGSELSSV